MLHRAITEELWLKSLAEIEAQTLCWLWGKILSAIWNRIQCCQFYVFIVVARPSELEAERSDGLFSYNSWTPVVFPLCPWPRWPGETWG